MIKLNSSYIWIFIVFFTLVSAGTLSLLAEKPPTAPAAKDAEDQAERAQKAAEVLSEIMAVPDEGIPSDLLAHAKGIAVIPHVVKGAFGFGGRFGKGLISHRNNNGMWSTPSYIEISGGSFGLQLGVEATDLVLVFTDEDGVTALLKGKLTWARTLRWLPVRLGEAHLQGPTFN